MDPNQGDINPEDYGGNSPSQNDNDKGYQNQEYMGDYNDNNEYFKNSLYMGEGNQYYDQNMGENREGMDYQEDESVEQEQKYRAENSEEENQRRMDEDEFGEDELDEDENMINEEGKEDDDYDENDDINESERYDYEGKGKKANREGENNPGKSINDDEEQREDDEDEDDEGQEGKDEEARNEEKEARRNEEGEKKEGEEGEEGDNEGEEQDGEDQDGEDQDGEDQDGEEQEGDNEDENAKEEKGEGEEAKGDGTEEKKEGMPMGMPEKRRPGKPSNKQRALDMQRQMAGPTLTEEERIQISMESGRRFNNKVMNNRLKLKVHMKQLEKNRFYENIPIELASAPFPSGFVPVYLYDANGSEYFSMNQGTQIERAQMGKFKRMNIENEGVTLIPEQFNVLGMYPGRKFQRKKRRRPAAPVKPQVTSDSD